MPSRKKRSQGNATHKESLELSEKVRAWALLNGLISDRRTNELIEDLEARDNWIYWSSCRPDEILSRPSLMQSQSLKIWYRRTLFLRNLMVFLPVTITWIAISEASSAFSEYIRVNEAALVNFLQFWQDGYGYLSPVWHLSTVALIDFFILAIIMLLTVGLQFLNYRAEKTEKEELARVSADRHDLNKELFEFFQKNQKISPLTMDRSLAVALRDLSKATQNLERLTKELGKSVKGFPSYINVLKEIKSLEKTIDRLNRKTDGSKPSL